VAAVRDAPPSAEDRLLKLLHFAESDVIIFVVRASGVHELDNGHKRDWERNRSWPEAPKREIVAASFAPGSSVSKVARH
jgi:hypothetical protein